LTPSRVAASGVKRTSTVEGGQSCRPRLRQSSLKLLTLAAVGELLRKRVPGTDRLYSLVVSWWHCWTRPWGSFDKWCRLVISLGWCAPSAFTCKRGLVSTLWPCGPDSAFLPWRQRRCMAPLTGGVESWPLVGPGLYLPEEAPPPACASGQRSSASPLHHGHLSPSHAGKGGAVRGPSP
jgi:hypothetical protein